MNTTTHPAAPKPNHLDAFVLDEIDWYMNYVVAQSHRLGFEADEVQIHLDEFCDFDGFDLLDDDTDPYDDDFLLAA